LRTRLLKGAKGQHSERTRPDETSGTDACYRAIDRKSEGLVEKEKGGGHGGPIKKSGPLRVGTEGGSQRGSSMRRKSQGGEREGDAPYSRSKINFLGEKVSLGKRHFPSLAKKEAERQGR